MTYILMEVEAPQFSEMPHSTIAHLDLLETFYFQGIEVFPV